MEAFEEAVGGREKLIDTLSLAPMDKKQEHFLRMLSDPKRASDSLATLVLDAGLLPTAVMELFRNAAFAKAHAIAMSQISTAVPEVISDMIGKSVDSEVTCPDCFGERVDGSPCLRCRDRGTILRVSDIDRQKLLLEISGVHKKSGGVNVQVNQQQVTNNLQPGTFFSRYVKDSDHSAYDVSVDAEIVDPAPPEPKA